MAFITRKGGRSRVHNGVSGKVLSTFASPAKARTELNRLHKRNKPKASARGKSAKRSTGR